MLLVYPPVVKPCEPPPGLAKLLGALKKHGIKCTVWDANLESILNLISPCNCSASDRWTNRANKNLSNNLALLRKSGGYENLDRYKRAVAELNRLVEKNSSSCIKGGETEQRGGLATSPFVRVSLSNYQDSQLSPVRSRDLIRSFEHPEQNLFYGYFSRRLIELIEREEPTVVGFSLNFLSQALCTFAMMGFLRQNFRDLKLVMGGGLVTSWIRRPGWKNPFEGLADLLVDGPGEAALLSLKAGSESCTGSADRLRQHFLPDYTSFLLNDYIAPGPILPYSASSGCYWSRCAFCPERAEQNPYIPVPVSSVLEDLKALVSNIKPALIHILDNAVSPSLMKALCKSPPGAPWYGFTRITHHLTDPDFCRDLKRSGCVMLKLGIESGDQSVLDLEQKGVELAMVSRALETIKRAGIATYVYLLFGTPSETLARARKTLEFTASHSQWIDFLNLAIFNLPVYGPEASRLETRMLYEGDLSLYTGFKHPKGWDRGLVRQFLDKEFKRHPAIAAILRNDPPFFTSNHAPFLCGG